MNKQRRAEIERAATLIDEAKGILEEARDEEQDYYDNLPDNFRDGERGDNAQSAISCLESACEALDGVDLGDATA
jgi:hypothetical protein